MRGSDIYVILIGSFIAVIIEFAYIIGFKNMGFISIKSSITIRDGFVYGRNDVRVEFDVRGCWGTSLYDSTPF